MQLRRALSTAGGSQTPATPAQPPPSTNPQRPQEDEFSPHENYIKPTMHVFATFRKIILYSSAASVSLAVLLLLGFEGTHLWVEKVAIAPTSKETSEDAIWGWSLDQESWTGGENGGTDPALGYKVRHLLHAAWMAQHWGVGVGSVGNREVLQGSSPGVVSAYRLAEQFLAQAIALVKEDPKIPFPPASGPTLSRTIKDLLTRHAHVLERIGTSESMTAARDELLILWQSLSSNVSTHAEAARIALKIGDISSRLHEGEIAVQWWQRAIDYATLTGKETSAAPQLDAPSPKVPLLLPPAPLAQRTVVSALVALSAYYATTNQLSKAEALETSFLRLLSSSYTNHVASSVDGNGNQSPLDAKNAAASLHSLFLQHRASTLSIHLAEVLYAIDIPNGKSPRKYWYKPLDGSQPYYIHLRLAATSSEKVAHSLTSVAKPYSGSPSAITQPLAEVYAHSPVLARPAANLLRDARRTAAQAWSLSGSLYELEGSEEDLNRALECFERAVHWSGGQHGMSESDKEVVEKEWESHWRNYSRVKERLSR